MALNTDMQGRTYVGAPFDVTRVKIAELARTLGFTDPVHFDPEAARAAGYRDVLAPPTFLITPAQVVERVYIDDPQAGFDYSRLLHVGQHFEYFEPVCAGDRITATLTVVSFKFRPKVSFVTTEVRFTDEAKRLFAVARATLGQR